VNFNFRTLCTVAIAIVSTQTFALPIDWNGSLGFDSNIIKNVRGTTDNCTGDTLGSQCITNDNDHARYQSVLLRLNPTIIVNDSTSIKGEISTGNIRGGFLGDDSEIANDGAYFSQTSSGSGSTLNVNQLYAELYADTALFKVGKFAKHYGLGAVINSGKNSWDRYYSLYNGVEAYFKLGNFKLIPVWAKVDTNGATPTGKYDAYETAITAMYDNSNINMKAGVYYAIREVETQNDLYGAGAGPHNINIIDIFMERVWGDFSIGLEVPIMSGEVGEAYGGTNQTVQSTSYILETNYQINPKWKLGFNGGMIKGSDSDNGEHEALYLHPNYQIAEIMFRYNLEGFQNSAENIFSSSIVNSNYAKLFARYHSDAWAWNFAFIMATANETAQNGESFFDHRKLQYTTASADQEEDLGWEFDISFDYEWNPNIFVTGFLGYYKVGEYYNFTNGANDIEVSDITATGLRLSLNF
jgi:hypothetical protein